MREDNAQLRKEVFERSEFMTMHANETAEANALIIELSELTVNVPGRRAIPSTNTWMERSSPNETANSKLRKTRSIWFFM